MISKLVGMLVGRKLKLVLTEELGPLVFEDLGLLHLQNE